MGSFFRWKMPTARAASPSMTAAIFSYQELFNQVIRGGNDDVTCPEGITFDRAPAPAPAPATIQLFGSGLAGLIGSRLRSKKLGVPATDYHGRVRSGPAFFIWNPTTDEISPHPPVSGSVPVFPKKMIFSENAGLKMARISYTCCQEC